MKFFKRNFLVLGAGISGISAANVLIKQGAGVTLSDAKPITELRSDHRAMIDPAVQLSFGEQTEALLEHQDCLVLSPGVSIYHPLVNIALTQGLEVISEVEMAFKLCKAPIIAITGTNGKTTTTTLVGEMLKTINPQTVVGGNIGTALSEQVLNVDKQGVVVAEISSFQLEAVDAFRAKIAAVLNLTPDHLERHRGFEAYQKMKERVFANQQSDDFTVLNYDDPLVRAMSPRVSGQQVFFSCRELLREGMCVVDDWIVLFWNNREVKICPLSIVALRGLHNRENVLAACTIAYFMGVPPENMSQVLAKFSGVEHRIEFVSTVAGVDYYNDSKATNPESAIKALESFSGQIILIAGGRDKHTDLSVMMNLIRERVEHLILLGEASERFNAAAIACGVANIHQVASFIEAVRLAHHLAIPPQVVLLSPACASYDMFNSYEERGLLFKKLVNDLGDGIAI